MNNIAITRIRAAEGTEPCIVDRRHNPPVYVAQLVYELVDGYEVETDKAFYGWTLEAVRAYLASLPLVPEYQTYATFQDDVLVKVVTRNVPILVAS